jgi:TPR repeat protein
MTKTDQASTLAETALDLDRELKRFEDLSGQASRVKLNSEKNLERATEALSRAAESQDRINAHVQRLVGAVQSARQTQEADAAALMARAQEIANRRAQFAQVLQRMGSLGQMAKEVQEILKEGTGRLDEVQEKMQQVADEATAIGRVADEQGMEDLSQKAEILRQQVLAAKNKVSLLSKKKSDA